MYPIKVLFLCVHNSAQSQIADAFLKKHGQNLFEVESAGLEQNKSLDSEQQLCDKYFFGIPYPFYF